MTSGNDKRRPDFAIEPGPGQESVWDYPRPPALRLDSRLIEVSSGGDIVASTRQGYKVMETASPPTFYIPPDAVRFELLEPIDATTFCEWKGVASYWTLRDAGDEPVAWSYPQPRPRFDAIKDYVAFYAERVDCVIGGEAVRTQAGRFYGGWITADIVGPFKGEPGTGHW